MIDAISKGLIVGKKDLIYTTYLYDEETLDMCIKMMPIDHLWFSTRPGRGMVGYRGTVQKGGKCNKKYIAIIFGKDNDPLMKLYNTLNTMRMLTK